MSKFYFNHHSNKSPHEQWLEYLQQSSYHSNTVDALNNFRYEYNNTAKLQLNAISDQGKQIENTLIEQNIKIERQTERQTFEIVGSIQEMSFEISESLNSFAEMIDWRMSELLDQQKIANILNYNIAQLLQIPDFQKERQYFIEQGIKHYKNAIINPELIKDALENLLAAEKLEKTDYFVLQRLGMIYLYHAKVVDLDKAKHYLTEAAKYASVESNPQAAHFANILTSDINKPIFSNKVDLTGIKKIAADSYFHAAISCYALCEYEESYNLALKAIQIFPQLYDVIFLAAKCLCADNKTSKAIPFLNEIIKANKLYASSVILDPVFADKKEVKDLLNQLCHEKNKELNSEIDKLKQNFLNSDVVTKSDFESIEKYLHKNSYFDALKGLSELPLLRSKFNERVNKKKQLSNALNSAQTILEYTSKNKTKINKFIIKVNASGVYIGSIENDVKSAINRFDSEFSYLSNLIKDHQNTEYIIKKTNELVDCQKNIISEINVKLNIAKNTLYQKSIKPQELLDKLNMNVKNAFNPMEGLASRIFYKSSDSDSDGDWGCIVGVIKMFLAVLFLGYAIIEVIIIYLIKTIKYVIALLRRNAFPYHSLLNDCKTKITILDGFIKDFNSIKITYN